MSELQAENHLLKRSNEALQKELKVIEIQCICIHVYVHVHIVYCMHMFCIFYCVSFVCTCLES